MGSWIHCVGGKTLVVTASGGPLVGRGILGSQLLLLCLSSVAYRLRGDVGSR
jgi:hypothetical protein